ncbi:type II toxin-antitoxin system RelE/ParE family toxin [Scandinavium sp.]|uniref:type II toxin-antitoxin system RelE/ParE family toxin n=1 Tax=Scandinavium sp. TaxID=2830653 RepID=UPI00289A0492|nr:type II toxin-antitoxin system RelE/ParE family toxin [Scandinavium sp.]
MIVSFRHKGLRNLFYYDETAGVHPWHVKRLKEQLTLLQAATPPRAMDIPGYRLHELKGGREGVWSVKVSGNWRLTFEFINGDAYLLDYEDYH